MDDGYGALATVPYSKFDYQERIIDEIRSRFQEKHRGVTVVSPTGSGKSYVVAKVLKLILEGGNKRGLYLAPRKLLVAGVSDKLTDFGIDHVVRMSGVQRQAGPMPNAQCWCTPSYFTFLKTLKKDDDRLGLEDATRPLHERVPHVDLFMIDEAHTHQPAIKKLWEWFPRSRFVYLTATPLPGMDRYTDCMVDGPSVGELQKRGILVPIRYKTYENDGRDVEALRGEIVETWVNQGENRKTVVFCKNRKEAKFIQERFLLHGIPAEYMDANTPQDERDAIRERVRTGVSKLVINVEVMGYGVDWPFIDCVVLAYVVEAKLQDTVTRLAEYVQKVGRGIRACEGKQDLVVIDHTGTVLLFGGVEQEIRWEIDSEGMRETAEEVIRKQKEERERTEPELITCQECGHQFIQLSECPVCGEQVIHQRSDEVQHVAARISEIDISTKRHKKGKESKQLSLWTPESATAAYKSILWCIRNKKKKDGTPYSDGMAKHVYDRLNTGIKPPWPTAVQPVEPDDAMKEWVNKSIKSHLANWAIRQRFSQQKKVA